MNRALRHRGPDDEGIVNFQFRQSDARGRSGRTKSDFRNSNSENLLISLGNTRLAIIDPTSAGHQPMHDPETGNRISYNGETYNFRELRRDIGNEFGPWHSNTDTEVVLRAYRKWGVEAFGKLRGMFALAIWDAAQQELILARDRFGIKPLYYYGGISESESQEASLKSNETPDERSETHNLFVFASEIRALLASGLVPRKLSREGLTSYLTYGSVQAPLTIIEGAQSLMPGQCLHVREGDFGLHVSCSDFLVPSQRNSKPVIRSHDAAVARLRAELEESVRLHLVSDVPLGVFLSGGMDSSAIVALMNCVSKEKPKTFSVVFDEEQFTEALHSRFIAEKFHTEHREVHLAENRLLQLLPDAVGSLDQPTIDGINTYVVSKAVKEAGVTVALSGLGGDELFGGYPSFSRTLKLQAVPGFTKGLLRAVSGMGKRALRGSVQRDKLWQLAASEGAPLDVYRVTRQLFAPEDVEGISGRPGGNPPRPAANGKSDSDDPFNAISKLELRGYMANTLLRDTDTMSMAHSLEVRVPFVDVELVNYVLGLPGAWKVNGDNGDRPKPLLAEALGELLPKDLLVRRKMGFTLPFEKWMQSSLLNEISSVLEREGRLTSAGLQSDAAARVWHRFVRSPEAVGWSRPWALYVLAKWCELNGVAN
jgi:asparagine synthase (glutamine-hydrolysing)